jgi:hypothetical protein
MTTCTAVRRRLPPAAVASDVWTVRGLIGLLS